MDGTWIVYSFVGGIAVGILFDTLLELRRVRKQREIIEKIESDVDKRMKKI